MKLSMTGQENVTFYYRWLLIRGDCTYRFDCIYKWNVTDRMFIYYVINIIL